MTIKKTRRLYLWGLTIHAFLWLYWSIYITGKSTCKSDANPNALLPWFRRQLHSGCSH